MSFLSIFGEWDWSSFGPDLVAGLITFALGLGAALFEFRRHLRVERERADKEYEELGRQVLEDLEWAESRLEAWSAIAARGGAIAPVDRPPLIWDAVRESAGLLIRRGVFRETERAFYWYRSAEEAVAEWNHEVATGGITPLTRRTVMLRTEGAITRARAASETLRHSLS